MQNLEPATTCSSLLVRVRDRADTGAWGRFAALYSPLLRDWLRRGGIPPHDHDDLVQDVLHAVAQEIAEFNYERR